MSRAALSAAELATRVHDLVQTYVRLRTESKSGIQWKDFKDRKVRDESGKERLDVPAKYREARTKVCTDAFLRLRACRAREDFVAYFTGTICSVPQFIRPDDYQEIALALLDGELWEDVKGLSMLALSRLSESI